MKNSLKNKIKYDYEKATEVPDSALWEKLEAKLDASESKIAPKKFDNINWLNYAAVILCLVALGILFKYNNQDNSSKNINPTITKLETPTNIEIQNRDSFGEVQKKEIQPIQNQEFVQSERSKVEYVNTEKFTSNSQDQHVKRPNPETNIDIKNIEKPIIQKEEKQIIADNTPNIPKNISREEYVKADELLFGRELQKKREQFANSNESKIGTFSNNLVQKIKPNSVTIFGITVYSEEQSN